MSDLRSCLPSFFVVGTQKAGTTTLYNMLLSTGKVSLPVTKETHFFNDVSRYEKGVEWYLQQFSKDDKGMVVGEIDPDYMFFQESALRIKKTINIPRFVFILREPVMRAYSHYLMSCRRGYECLSFKEALEVEDSRLSVQDNMFPLKHHSYIARGLYSEQIRSFRKVFPGSSMLFIKFDDLFDPETKFKTFIEICDFIGARDVMEVDLDVQSNRSSEPRSILVRKLLYGESLLKKIVGKLLFSRFVRIKVFRLIENMNLRTTAKDESGKVISEVPVEIRQKIKHDLNEVESLTSLDLSSWKELLDNKL